MNISENYLSASLSEISKNHEDLVNKIKENGLNDYDIKPDLYKLGAKIEELNTKIIDLISKSDPLSTKKIEELKAISTKLKEISDSIDRLRGNIPTIFVSEKLQSQESLIATLTSEIREGIVKFFLFASAGFLFPPHKEAVDNNRFVKSYSKSLPKNHSIQDTVKFMEEQNQKHAQSIKQSDLDRMEGLDFYERKGEEMRQHACVLGGERVTIRTSDNENLDGMYLDARAFREAIKKAGGELVTYTLKNDNEKSQTLQGISLSNEEWNISGKKILKALQSLHGIADSPNVKNPHPGAGWAVVKEGENVLLVRSESLPSDSIEVKTHPFFNWDWPTSMWSLKSENPEAIERKSQTIDDKSKSSGTVILSSGNLDLYEKMKSEALSFLFRDMNVVIFNYRGYGKSTGIPSEKGLKLDMEAAYQLAKRKSDHEDNKILLKALCMSGGPAAYVGSKHPEINLFLDQSYSDFKTFAKQQMKVIIERVLNPLMDKPAAELIKSRVIKQLAKMIATIINPFIQFMLPDFKTAEYLAQNKGKKAIFFALEDQYIKADQIEKNLNAIAKAGQIHNVSLFSGPGSHGVALLDINSSPLDYSVEGKKIKEALEKLVESEENLKDSKEIEKLESIKLEKIELLAADANSANLLKKERTALNQMGHFLRKAGLSNDIIPKSPAATLK